jgi:collagen type VI alpha
VHIVEKLEIGSSQARVGIVVYSDSAQSIFYLNSYFDKSQMIDAINRIDYIGSSSNLVAGLQEMIYWQFTMDYGDRPDVPNVAILITDSLSSVDAVNMLPEVEAAKNKGIHRIAVGITGAVDENTLKAISSEPHVHGTSYWMISNFLVLEENVAALVSKMLYKPAGKFHPP